MDAVKHEYLARIAPQAALHRAQVIARDGESLKVGGAWGSLEARRAASCQLQPEAGDVVLISYETPEQAYVIAVLERGSTVIACTLLGEGVSLQVEAPGKLTVHADQSLCLRSDDVSVIGRTARFLIGRISMVSREAMLSLQSGRLVGEVFESTIGRLSQWLGHSQRNVKGLDQTHSGAVELRAEQTLTLQGRHLLASAEQLARIDGDQVHIG